MIARDVPFLEEIDRPAVHAHRADGQDQGERSIVVARLLDRPGDLVPHHDVKVGDRIAGDRLEARMPPGLTPADRLGRMRAASVDLGEVPAPWQKPSIIDPANVVNKFMIVQTDDYSIVITTLPVRLARAFQGLFFEKPHGFDCGRKRKCAADKRL